MRTITISNPQQHDDELTFPINVGRNLYAKGLLKRGYRTKDDGILWIMQCSGVLKDTYTAADRKEAARLHATYPVQDKETVLVFDEHNVPRQYRVRVLGDYSDCAILDPQLELIA